MENIRVLDPVQTGFVPAINSSADTNPNESISKGAQKTFLNALNGNVVGKPLKWTPLCLEGGNVIIEVDEEDIENEAQQCVYDIVGRVTYQKGDKPFSTPELKTKLDALWKITYFISRILIRVFTMHC